MPSSGKKRPTSQQTPWWDIRPWSRWSQAALVVIVLGAFLRLWNLPASLQFLGDQGRDAMIVADIFKKFDLVFIGPVTSIGNMYLGPLYYYFMVPFLWLTYPSPMGPVYAIAVLSIITLALMYYWGKQMFDERTAFIATTFMAFSAATIVYSRFSWNPNPAPFVALLMVYGIWQAWNQKHWYWPLVGLAFSILIQLHYLTLLSGGAAGLLWLIITLEPPTWSARRQQLMKMALPTIVAIVIFFASLLPLALFDLKHDYLNSRAFIQMVTHLSADGEKGPVTPSQKVWQITKETHGRGMHILFEMMIGQTRWLNTGLLIAVIGILGWLVKQRHTRPHYKAEVIMVVFLIVTILGTAVYPGSVFNHYIAYTYPITFFIYAIIFNYLLSKNKILGGITLTLFSLLFAYINIKANPIQAVGWQITNIKALSQTIYDRVQPGEKYNIVLLSETGDIDGQNYRYFLTTTDRPPVTLEHRGEVETLFIIDEQRTLKKVTESPIWEIVVFPDKNPKEVYNGGGHIEVTVLRKSE